MDLNLAVLIDFDNIAKGTQEDGLGDFDARVIMRRLKDKGRILVARAYCDWDRWPKKHRTALLEQGVTMVELTSHAGSNKNRGDIALAVDAMELAYTRGYIDAYVVVSGDSDFTPLVMRLKELNRRVIGIGTRRATSRLIANLCDEFLFYDTLLAPSPDDSGDVTEPLSRDAAFALLVETLVNHQRDEAGPVPSGVLKQAMKRKVPSFSEVDLGFSSFGRFLEKAQEKGRIVLNRDERGGGFRVDLPNAAAEPVTIAVAPPEPPRADPFEAALADAGLDLPPLAARRALAEAFVRVSHERAAQDRKCAVQFVIGDLLNLKLPARADEVRGFCNSLFRSGLLLHADGEPVRKPTSPFIPPTDAEALLAGLEAKVHAALEAKGLSAPPAPEAEAPAEEDGRRRRKRGGRRGRGRDRDEPAAELAEAASEAAASEADAEAPATELPEVEAAPEPEERPAPEAVEADAVEAEADAPSADEGRRRRKRGGRRGRGKKESTEQPASEAPIPEAAPSAAEPAEPPAVRKRKAPSGEKKPRGKKKSED